jgi:hypothetical protein
MRKRPRQRPRGMRRVARRRNRCRSKAPSRRRAPRSPTRKRSRSATNSRDPTACSARPQELTRKFAHQRPRRAICRSFLHPAALAAIRRSGRNKSGVAATSRRGRLACSSNKEPPSGGLLFGSSLLSELVEYRRMRGVCTDIEVFASWERGQYLMRNRLSLTVLSIVIVVAMAGWLWLLFKVAARLVGY